MKLDRQKGLYKDLYKKKEYLFPLPDYKITDNHELAGKDILVIGSGTGRDIWYLAGKNKITALDNSNSVKDILQEKGIRLTIADISQKLPFKNKSFDLIIAKDILEHLSYPMEITKEINRLLKDDGYAVINVPNHFFILMRLKYILGGNLIWKTPGIDHEKLFQEWDYMHIRYFTWKGFQSMIKKANLRIIRNFFDLGTLNHYTDPDLIKIYFADNKTTHRYIFLLNIFNVIFPKKVRAWISSLNPGLLTASFYVWVAKV